MPLATRDRRHVVLPDEGDEGEGELHPLRVDLLEQEGVEFDDLFVSGDEGDGEDVFDVAS